MLTETQTTVSTSAADAPVSQTEPPVALKDGEPTGEKPRILEEVVIEEVSIDGMCGVY